MQQSAEVLRFSFQLIDTRSGAYVWSDKIDVPATDLLGVEDQIAEKLAAALQVRFVTTPSRTATHSTRAYEDSLKGRYHYLLKTPAHLEQARVSLNEAVSEDANFALAQAWLAIAEVWTASRYAIGDRQDALFRSAEAHAARAMALDSGSGESQLAHGLLFGSPRSRCDWNVEIPFVLSALDLSPALDEAREELVRAFMHLGLVEQAWREIRRMQESWPNSEHQWRDMPNWLLSDHRIHEGEAEARRQLVTAPADPILLRHLGHSLLLQRRYAEAAAPLRRAISLSATDTYSLSALAEAYAGQQLGAQSRAAIQDALNHNGAENHHALYGIGAAYALLGDKSAALRYLKQAVDGGYLPYPWYAADVNLTPLRADTDFQAFLGDLRVKWEANRKRYARQTP